MRNLKFLITVLSIATFTLTSCSSSDDSIENSTENTYKDGIFVLAEGAMGSSNAEVTFYKNGTATQELFKLVNNGKVLGNTAQSILLEDDNFYIVVNGSNKIEVVSTGSFQYKKTITEGLISPRYAVADDKNLYVSNWGDPSSPSDDFISVYRLADLSFVEKIEVTEGPEQMIIENNKLVIAHAGGWNNGNSVTIYNTATKNKNNFVVGDVPSAIVEEDNQVYVLCTGITWGGTPSAGKLVTINLNSEKITQTLDFKEGENPRFLAEEGNQLFYTVNNKVYKKSTTATTLTQTPLFTADIQYMYGFNVKNNSIYVSDAKDYSSNGEVKIYNQSGSLLTNFSTGVGPNTILFD